MEMRYYFKSILKASLFLTNEKFRMHLFQLSLNSRKVVLNS